MTTRSPLRSWHAIALSVALLLVPSAAAAAGDGPPKVSLGNLAGPYQSALPYITLALVAFGLYVVVMRIWSALGSMRTVTPVWNNGQAQAGTPKGIDLLVSLVVVLALVAGGVYLLYNWVDLVNGLLEAFYSLTRDVATGSLPGVGSLLA